MKKGKKVIKDFTERRSRVKQGIRENQDYSPREARHRSRENYKKAKKDYKLAKKDYKRHKNPRHETAKGRHFREKLSEAKQEKRVAKKVHKHAQERDGGSFTTKVRRKAYQTGRFKLRQDAERTVQDNDILNGWVKARQKIREFQRHRQTSQQAATIVGRGGRFLVQKNYGFLNKSYNFVRGRGFTRTPKEFSWEEKVRKKWRQAQKRFRQMKIAKVGRGAGKVVNFILSPIKKILYNPLAIKSYFLMILVFGVIALIMGIFGGSGPVQQNEFDLNRSWLHISKRDREKSTEKVDYWTNIDEILYYMNYRYGGEWNPEASWKQGTGGSISAFFGFNRFSDALDDVWNHLNQEPEQLKTMAELMKKDSPAKWMRLSEKELEEYQELESLIEEMGRYPSYQELSNPFYSEEDSAHFNAPLTILKRYGYTSKTEIYENTELKATTGQTLRAVLSGTVKIEGEDVVIVTKEARFTYKQVAGLRFKDGETVEAGEEIGKVKTNGFQEIRYQKLEEKATKTTKEKWTTVNPGFYFTSVSYSQTTSVLSDLELSGDLAGRAQAVRNRIKKKVPNSKDNGIAAMLGNYATESGANPKRAEGDYLPPPVGATDSSWDNPEWLSMGGTVIYNGRFPNILHRGLGLGQWTDTADGSTRHTLLLNYAKSKGKKWYDLELQIDFMLEGDAPYYQQIFKEILTSSEDVNTLTERFLVLWEGNPGDKLLERQNNAQQMLVYFKQTVRGGSGTLASSWNFPEEYRNRVKRPPSTASMTAQAGNAYPIGQCTWYVYNRLVELGSITDLSGTYGYLGNGQNWVSSLVAKGWKYSVTPSVGAVVSTAGGFDGTYADYGHVAVVEAVNADGSFLVSELNYAGNQTQVHFRVCRPAAYYSFATPK